MSSIPHASRQVKATFWRYWYSPDATPIFLLTGGALLGAGLFGVRAARSPMVVWDFHGKPEPYQAIDQDTNTKLMTVNVSSCIPPI